MGFIRVRQATGPAHEFDVPAAAYARKKHAYVVVDFEPVATPRPVKYVAALPPKAVPKRAAGKE